MKNWLIKLLGGDIPEDRGHRHLELVAAYSRGRVEGSLDETKIKRLIDHAISGVFFNLRTNPGKLIRKSRKKSANMSFSQLEKKLLKNIKNAK